jgi:hypothetical protein
MIAVLLSADWPVHLPNSQNYPDVTDSRHRRDIRDGP